IPPSTLVADLIGGSLIDYQRGQNRPVMSLRDAINILLRGELPGLPEMLFPSISGQSDALYDGFEPNGFTFDRAGGALAFWTSSGNNVGQVLGARWDPANPTGGFTG